MKIWKCSNSKHNVVGEGEVWFSENFSLLFFRLYFCFLISTDLHCVYLVLGMSIYNTNNNKYKWCIPGPLDRIYSIKHLVMTVWTVCNMFIRWNRLRLVFIGVIDQIFSKFVFIMKLIRMFARTVWIKTGRYKSL